LTSDPDYQRFVGFVDYSEGGVIGGWAVDLENSCQPAEVDIYVDGFRTRTVTADHDRPDCFCVGLAALLGHDNLSPDMMSLALRPSNWVRFEKVNYGPHPCWPPTPSRHGESETS
jgi:hypothetical protein